MGIFQKSVIQKHLSNLDKELVEKAFQKFRENYNPSKIEKIKELKEEEYQDGFLRDLFVDVFGYTLKPNDDYNLAREFKNQGDGKKADGAILKNEKAVAVIELKSTKTKDLKSITEQAFNYKNNQPDCKYVITSNFQKLRFYIDYANEFEEFDLFHLQRTDFDLLFLILNSNSVFSDLPIKLKEETKFHEQDISDKLYKDYSIFKNRLFENLIKNNPEKDKLTLFNKSQKLLDRFLFILFAEDSGLLPPNSISRIIDTYHKLEELYQEKLIYDLYKQYFGFLNTGRKGKTKADDIPAYNGGLFYPDELLDNLRIDDEILINDLRKLSEYDFNTEVDVNILGHIFEHSLSEIEEITAELSASRGHVPLTSKRKKDGVFYTPKYITQYIVENTIGKLCNEKRTELEIEEIEFDGTYRTKDGNLSVKGKKLYKKLNDYKDWMLSLKIVDPACGSGAFLNQALNFLILEHKTIDDIIAELTNTALRLFDTEKSILENNLFGVDINEESVEIAKLSLWLRTAHKDRKLSNLNNNIKCGNSLIDDPEIAGNKAFDWNLEFKEIMQNGGFDVVIGNPPYGMDNTVKRKVYYNKEFKLLEGRYDLFELFIEKSIHLINNQGHLSFIIPNTLLSNLYSKKLRRSILDNYKLVEITNFGMDVFEDPTIHTCIIKICQKDNKTNKIRIRKQVNSPIELSIDYDYTIDEKTFLSSENSAFDIFFNPDEQKLFNKLLRFETLGSICHIRQCIKTGNDKIYVKKSDVELEAPWKRALRGKGIGRYFINEFDLYLMYGDWLARNWKNKSFYETNKIIIRETGNRITATIDTDNHYLLSSLYSIYPKTSFTNQYLHALLSVLNSSFATFFIKKIAFELTKGAFTKVRTNQLARLPIPVISEVNINVLFDHTLKILSLTKDLNSLTQKFSNYLIAKTKIELSKKLQNWSILDFAVFIKELNKAIKKASLKKLSKTDEMEWMEVYENKKLEIQSLKSEIEKTDKEIDQMVYKLYGLTEEEIKLVEESV